MDGFYVNVGLDRLVTMRYGVSATPDWIRDRLTRIGEASVHPLVDLSNYVMFTTGQPTHVYDAPPATAASQREFAPFHVMPET